MDNQAREYDVGGRAFQKDGRPAPEGTKLLGRWHEMGSGHGFALIEFDDPVAVARGNIEWSDLLDEKIVPVIDDAQLAAALK